MLAASVMGGAILQVFLSPPDIVTAPPDAGGGTFGACADSGSCGSWQAAYITGCTLTICLVVMALLAGATAAVGQGKEALPIATVSFLLALGSTAVAVLSVAFLAFPAPQAVLVSVLLALMMVACLLFAARALLLDAWLFGPRLRRAVSAGDDRGVALMLMLHADPDGTDEEDRTALHLAAMAGHFKIAKRLLGAQVRAPPPLPAPPSPRVPCMLHPCPLCAPCLCAGQPKPCRR